MKNSSPFAFLLMSFCMVYILFSCEKEQPTDTSNPVSIAGIYPNSNPVGGPVMIEGEGFMEETEVYFNDIPATIEERSPTFLTTKVPNGLGATTVTVRVENGRHSDEKPFDVLAAFPSDLPSSPPVIIIPNTGVISPIFISEDAPCYYSLRNIYNPDHRMKLSTIDWLDVEDCTINCEFSEIIGEHKFPLRVDWEDQVLNCESTIPAREIGWIEVNRSGSPYQSDKFTGIFFTDSDFGFPNSFTPPGNNWENVTENFLLLTSEITARQYLFVVTVYGFEEFE